MRSKLVVGLCVLAACGYPKAGPIPAPINPASMAAVQQRWPDATGEQLATGRALFAAKCNSCHDYPAVDAVTDEEWRPVVNRMGRKAKLSGDESEAVLRFILASRG